MISELTTQQIDQVSGGMSYLEIDWLANYDVSQISLSLESSNVAGPYPGTGIGLTGIYLGGSFSSLPITTSLPGPGGPSDQQYRES
ncbi:MAG: hypothetical protein KDI36_00580 [Pseudomonadales bacterium]|nr:hypothetical protein [Pseudomonadales bacterium]